MPLQYVIDGYNLTNHPRFGRRIPELLDFIQTARPCGKPRGNIIVVFDGYPDSVYRSEGIQVIFSKDISADDYIKKLLERSPNPRQITVVSDDNEIRLFSRYCQAQSLKVEDFMDARKKVSRPREDLKPELSFTQVRRINEELKKVWL